MPLDDPNPKPSPAPDRAFCQILGWKVFEPGYHKGKLYSLADCQRMAANFKRLSTGAKPVLVPTASLGHDAEARFQASLGFPNIGLITRLDCTPEGIIEIDVDRVPTTVGEQISAGNLNTGSIELIGSLPDPDNQAVEIAGPIFTGVAILGEEQPQLKGFAPPRATFRDGTPVPPNAVRPEWLTAMARTQQSFSAVGPPTTVKRRPVNYLGRQYMSDSIAFSEMFGMDRPGILDRLRQLGIPIDDPAVSGLSDSDLKRKLDEASLRAAKMSKKLMAAKKFAAMFSAAPDKEKFSDEDFKKADPEGHSALFSDEPVTAPVAQPNTPPNGESGGGTSKPAWMAAMDELAGDPSAGAPMQAMAKAFSKAFSMFSDDCTKRFGALEAAVNGAEKKGDQAEMAAFSAALDDAVIRGAIAPSEKEVYLDSAATKAKDRQTFSTGPTKGMTPLQAFTQAIKAKPASHMFVDVLHDTDPADAASDPFIKRALEHLPGGRPHAYPLASAKK